MRICRDLRVKHDLSKAGKCLIGIAGLMLLAFSCMAQSTQTSRCALRQVAFHGWHAEQLYNHWLALTLVPQLGGRLMQVEFNGHSYLFVNPAFAGQYIPPSQAAGKWINYGGDKIWPMPEGSHDEDHWVLESGTLDDAPYRFQLLEQGKTCKVELTGPSDQVTGLQYSRVISIDASSPVIHFHAVMRNATAHTLHWSVQSVSQYNLADAINPQKMNRNFYAYTPVNPSSAYLEQYHVRSGLADSPAFHVRNGLFQLHWTYYSSEVWIDSTAGWLALFDGQSRYAMVEHYKWNPTAQYPGKATVIFYQNGPSVSFNDAGNPVIPPYDSGQQPYYMEAELNSPLVTLDAGSSYAFDSTWYPLRISGPVATVTESGVVTAHLVAAQAGADLLLTGMFGAFRRGTLQLRLYDQSGSEYKTLNLGPVSPDQPIVLHQEIHPDQPTSRVSLHLLDQQGNDLGLLDVATIQPEKDR